MLLLVKRLPSSDSILLPATEAVYTRANDDVFDYVSQTIPLPSCANGGSGHESSAPFDRYDPLRVDITLRNLASCFSRDRGYLHYVLTRGHGIRVT